LARLMLRLYDPDAGTVHVDGRDLREVKAESLQEQIGIVLQETYLFQGTIRDQLLFSKPDASDDEIRQAVEAADLAEFVETLPQGLNTDLAEGTRLSGGQKQRIGIARALVREPRLMILDEPTASLDSDTEAEVMATLWRAMRGKTSILISHRLGLVRQLDRILVVDDGRVVEDGNHDELLRANGLYAELWNEQYGEAATA
jgi:ABC-type multidrug transport system fused ATPase/permease subunit